MITLNTNTIDRVLLNAQRRGKIPKTGVVLNLGDGLHTRKAFELHGYEFHDYEALGLLPKNADILYVDPLPGQMHEVFQIFKEQAKPKAVLLVLGSEESWQYNGDPGVTHAGTTRIPRNGTYTVYRK